MKPITAIALSGGIDSSTAAYILQQEGHSVIGIHFITGYETLVPHVAGHLPSMGVDSRVQFANNYASAVKKIAHVTQQIGIPFEIIDCRREFQTHVIDYFMQAYQYGRTPNPCLVCNPSIKFGTLLQAALRLGATRLATGHYARIREAPRGVFHLLKGFDVNKDQSYFLAFMAQLQLAQAVFPLGKMVKSEVKKMAGAIGLTPAVTQESQDICFVGNDAYHKFLERLPAFKSGPGPIVDTKGNILGEHPGLHFFTIGQRRGINRPASEPYYVIRMDAAANRLVVGFKKDIFSKNCRVKGINWIQPAPDKPVQLHVRIRYRHNAARATLYPHGQRYARVKFEIPQEAVTPGQGAVFYRDDEVLGGGWIDSLMEAP